ncbi:hypothetical protein HDR58_02595 [bacterium]|nr:hypothetical protein [bacterium]
MKKLLIFFAFVSILLFGIGQTAYSKDIIPVRPNVVTTRTVGLYQVGNDVKIYKEPDENSQILYRVRWNADEFFPDCIGAEKFFVVLLPKKELALIHVVDVTEDWVEIIYNNSTGETGWIKKDDPYKFMTWINFYNSYGKKYGLRLLKSSPEKCKDMKAAPEDLSKTISTMNMPQKINLNVIRGNWALVSVMDLDKTPKTGYIRWRSDDGIRYFFPAIK